LIKNAIGAMQKAQDLEINTYNTAVGVVGIDRDFKVLSSSELSSYFNQMEIS